MSGNSGLDVDYADPNYDYTVPYGLYGDWVANGGYDGRLFWVSDGTALASFTGHATGQSDAQACQDEVAAGFAGNPDGADLAQFVDGDGVLVEQSGDGWALGEYAYTFVDVYTDGARYPYVAWIACVLDHPGQSGVAVVLLAPDYAMTDYEPTLFGILNGADYSGAWAADAPVELRFDAAGNLIDAGTGEQLISNDGGSYTTTDTPNIVASGGGNLVSIVRVP